MVTVSDTFLMQKALDAAWAYQVLTFPNPAVGAVISNDLGDIIAIGAHHKAGLAHAEVIALKEAYILLSGDTTLTLVEDSTLIHDYLSLHHNNIFHDLTLHVTLEPCHHYGKTPPCSKLIHTLGIKRVVIGAHDASAQAQGGGAFLAQQGVDVSFGCLKEACELLLSPFTCKEQKRPFIFFKIALSANHVATGGIITSLDSRKMVHRLRDCCDLLVIGGNTVRLDKPVLDARLCDGKAPDILIYSHHMNFDNTLPLLSVPNRNVRIEASLNVLQTYHMVMIEGGQQLLNALQNEVEWYLVFQSPYNKEGDAITLPKGLTKVFSQPIGEDTMTWYFKNA